VGVRPPFGLPCARTHRGRRFPVVFWFHRERLSALGSKSGDRTMLKTCMPVALAAFLFASVSAPNAEAFEMRHGARMAPANFKAMRHGEFARGGDRHGLGRHSHRHF